MCGYVIGALEVENPELLAEYRARIPAVLEQYGGTFVVAGPVTARLEGAAAPSTVVVIKFDSVEQATRWYESPEYRAIRGIRQRSGHGSLLIVEGTQ